MPIAIVLSLSFLMPWLLIFSRRHTEEVSANFFSWFFLFLFGYQTLAATPYLLYTFRFVTGWSTFYLIDPERFPIITTEPLALSAILVGIGYLLMIISFAYSRLTWNSGHVFAFQLPWVISVATIATTATLYHDRIIRVADYAAFWDGSGEMLYLHPVCWSFGAVIILAIITLHLSFKLK